MPSSFSTQLIKWYQKHGRHDLPWQKNQTPYRVWISEIMLQQTQVTTVIPYYERFMQSFPTIKSLALASEDEVLAHWSGLGYYARARNIHKSAKIIHEKYRGKFPKTIDDITELPGIGKSTAGAIISFAHQEKGVILDGNVKRVLTRYFAMDSSINEKSTIDQLWQLAEKLTPEKHANHFNQAMMDLGATLCTRSKPRCTDCPFKKTCQAHQQHNPTFYPVKTIKKTRPVKQKRLLIIENQQGEILLTKRPAKGIWGGLWSLPEIELNTSYDKFENITLHYHDEYEKIIHQFTHYTLEIFPMHLTTKQNKLTSANFVWYNTNNPLPGGIPSPITKILQELK
jgi:A/G-specific adenine glycosylase